ncbi:hypothetical protein FFLO_00903 [Filobasidium floriforme]|uniref:Uncharacterized protein n=1 Tax=Filobasidium floriforme TaxID=5210 RepID=A0A8K0JQS0_9TREE|nr:uncharacterized protein HD553DRAFT_309158 [Filobasidium floriforme]KAG7571230.1 hypothetical protein FFLO_00903 [Filobasidium floriforme]KAH8087071.1 hypothetical protein HD553DRAFT_309158 [Filobasidium floriforme]
MLVVAVAIETLSRVIVAWAGWVRSEFVRCLLPPFLSTENYAEMIISRGYTGGEYGLAGRDRRRCRTWVRF